MMKVAHKFLLVQMVIQLLLEHRIMMEQDRMLDMFVFMSGVVLHGRKKEQTSMVKQQVMKAAIQCRLTLMGIPSQLEHQKMGLMDKHVFTNGVVLHGFKKEQISMVKRRLIRVADPYRLVQMATHLQLVLLGIVAQEIRQVMLEFINGPVLHGVKPEQI